MKKFPERCNLIINGNISDVVELVCEGLRFQNLEWQFIANEYKLKCRKRIYLKELWENI